MRLGLWVSTVHGRLQGLAGPWHHPTSIFWVSGFSGTQNPTMMFESHHDVIGHTTGQATCMSPCGLYRQKSIKPSIPGSSGAKPFSKTTRASLPTSVGVRRAARLQIPQLPSKTETLICPCWPWRQAWGSHSELGWVGSVFTFKGGFGLWFRWGTRFEYRFGFLSQLRVHD